MVICITAVGGILRFYQLDVADGTIDELGLSAKLLGKSAPEMFKVISGAPPIPFCLQWLCMLFTGQDDKFGIRLSSVLIGVLSIPLIYRWIRSVACQRSAFMAACILAGSYYHFTYSREGRYYTCVFFFATLFFWLAAVFVRQPRMTNALYFALSAVCLALSHFFGLLAVASCLLALPVCLVNKRALSQLRQHYIGLSLAGLVIVPTAFLIRGSLFPWITMSFLQRHANSGKLTHAFDISPRFLFNRFAVYLGVPDSIAYLLAAMALVGLAVLFWRSWRIGIIYLSVIVLPWLIIFYSKPEHFWDTKYFIFMLPILILLVSMGMMQAVSAARTPLFRSKEQSRLRPYFSCCAYIMIGGLICIPNLQRMAADFRYPANGIQRAVKMLSASAPPSDTLYCTTRKSLFSFRYFGKRHPGKFMKTVQSQDISGAWNLESADRIWVADIGRFTNSELQASFLYSDRFSRIPLRSHWGHFLAHGPNVQNIRFGHNASGSPDVRGSLTIARQQSAAVNVLFPRSGRRAAVAKARYKVGQGESLQCVIDGTQTLNLEAFGDLGEGWRSFVGIDDLPFGPREVGIVNGGNSAVELASLSFVPLLEEPFVTLPAWDFLRIEAGLPHGIHISHEGPEVVLNTLLTSRIVYSFFAAQDMYFTVTFRGKNDRPFDNSYVVYLFDTAMQKEEVTFSEKDDSITSLTTRPLRARRGLNSLVVEALLPDQAMLDEAQRNIFGHVVSTTERKCASALVSLTLTPTAQGAQGSDNDWPAVSGIVAALRQGGVLFYFGAAPRDTQSSDNNLPIYEFIHNAIAKDPTLSAGVTEYSGTEAKQLRDVMRKHPDENIWILSENGKLGASAQMALFALAPSPVIQGDYVLSLLARPSVNLFPHGDFEVRRLENISLTEGVTVVHPPHAFNGNNTVRLEANQRGTSVAASFHVVSDEQGNATTSLQDGKTYCLSFWMKHENVEPGAGWDQVIRVALTGEDGDGQPFFNEIMSVRGSQGWTRYALPFEVGRELPSNSTDVTVRIGLFGGTGALWLDDVQLEPGASATPFTRVRRVSHTERLAQMGF